MAVSMQQQMMSALPQLRYQPTLKNLRVRLGDADVAVTDHPMLVWEPMRVVPSYAVTEAEISASLCPAEARPPPEHRPVHLADSPPLLDPSIPFSVHTAAGEALTVTAAGERRVAAGFRLADPDLSGYVVLDFDAFDWWEEDEQIIGHPRDPYHRIDVRPSSRTVRIEHEGYLLAESRRCHMLFEGTFPLVRYYLPPEDVRVELLEGALQTTCAYKGRATHYTAMHGDHALLDIAWSYEDPLEDAARVAGLVSFYQERLDLTVDGVPVRRVRTPWS